jgi:hypothetical protein
MPLSKYFHGAGPKIMREMSKTYPTKAKAESVFYALANKRKEKPDSKLKSSMRAVMKGRGGSKPGRTRD